MIKFSNDDAHALEPAVFFLAQLARDALIARHRREENTVRLPLPTPRRMDVEDKFSILDNYDTVFLVDDSPSMAGERWDLVKKILDYSTSLSTNYDPDGIDVHFLNNKTANQDNIRDQAVAVDIHQRIQLKGSTPLYDQLSRHIQGYIDKFNNRARNDLNFKSYNLVVLTDGEPDQDFEDEDDISDPEDARVTAPAFRLIRKEIVDVARTLDKAHAARGQVGIQFCQIGDDPGARKFFEYLDNRVKGKYKLKRDVSTLGPLVPTYILIHVRWLTQFHVSRKTISVKSSSESCCWELLTKRSIARPWRPQARLRWRLTTTHITSNMLTSRMRRNKRNMDTQIWSSDTLTATLLCITYKGVNRTPGFLHTWSSLVSSLRHSCHANHLYLIQPQSYPSVRLHDPRPPDKEDGGRHLDPASTSLRNDSSAFLQP